MKLDLGYIGLIAAGVTLGVYVERKLAPKFDNLLGGLKTATTATPATAAGAV